MPENGSSTLERQIGPYRILEVIGRGGMGLVLRAQDPQGQTVALKLLTRAGSDPARQRFLREARALFRLRHEHVMRILQVGEHAGQPYLVMPLIEGLSLHEHLIRAGALPLAKALEIAEKLALALQHAHKHNVLHRDVKPANVILSQAGEPLLTDFGLTRDLDPSLTNTRLSKDGTFLGTPGYWPPEQAGGQLDRIGPASDVYSLGATLYAMLTGESPHGDTASSPMQALHAALNPPQPPSRINSQLPPWVDEICLRCLQRDPADRYSSAGELAEELRDARQRSTGGGKTRSLALLASVALASVLLTGWLIYSRGTGPLPQNAPASPTASATPADSPSPEDSLSLPHTPAWLAELPPDRRPELPLPEGLDWGGLPGEYLALKDKSVLVWVPAGTFLMGSEFGWHVDEAPVHRVRLTRGFFIGKYEVSWKQFRRFCAAADHEEPSPRLSMGFEELTAADDHPVFDLSWEDAQAYCAWAGLRLPTEAEWEYAAGGGAQTKYPWGDELSPDTLVANVPDVTYLNWAKRHGGGDTESPIHFAQIYDDGAFFPTPVGSYPAGTSHSGSLDMIGNVWEWVSDWHSEYTAKAQVDPQGPSSGNFRVYRGGACLGALGDARVASREAGAPEVKGAYIGVRVARSP